MMTPERLARIKSNHLHASPHIKAREMWKVNDELIAEVERLQAELRERTEDAESWRQLLRDIAKRTHRHAGDGHSLA